MAVRNPNEIFIQPDEIPPACQGELHPMAVRGIQLFNERKYWEAHEALEAAWRDEAGPVRYLYQGILQAGVTYLQIERRNFIGMAKMFERSKKWLGPWPPVCRGVDVEQLRRDVAAAVTAASALGPERLGEFDESFYKKVQFASTDQSSQP